jgi:hypothetical protein
MEIGMNLLRKSISCSVSFEPRDIWIGVYWHRIVDDGWNALFVYVCIVPMLPIRFVLGN